MPTKMSGEFGFMRPGAGPARRREPESPLRILIMGDFSGAAERPPVAERRALKIDVDNVEAMVARMAPKLRLTFADTTVEIDIRAVDDFHPDRLFETFDLFAELRATRARLRDPATAAATAAALGAAAPAAAPTGDDDDSSLESLLGKESSTAGRTQTTGGTVDISQFIENVVADAVVADTQSEEAAALAGLDRAISEPMRALLHEPAFQALESLWRSVDALVRAAGEDVDICILDLTKTELAEEMRQAAAGMHESALYRNFVDEIVTEAGVEPWSLWLGAYSFGRESWDAGVLSAVGTMAALAGGPFVAAADPAVLGATGFAAQPDSTDWAPPEGDAANTWQVLRKAPVAEWVGLAAPRLLVRLPYGAQTEPAERFDFDELGGTPGHEDFLWGNPAFGAARLIVEGFARSGWELALAELTDVEDLPSYSYQQDGESRLLPCAEAFLGERAAETILDAGIMPMLSYRNRNAVRVLRFQSIAAPAKALAGPWA